MKKESKFLLLFVIFAILFINPISSMNVSEYEYFSKIKVNCEEYKGYARFELPNEYNSLNSPKSYMDIEHYIHKTYNQDYYKKIDNWFVKQIEGHSVSEVEKIFDNNYETYLVDENNENIEFT
ncbi:hypothetical protein GF386_04765, partial [Candidatus Pacearchaeota archaeon]|nr:hypothetical protein [Candidatus Pacearchaeota archaeon]